MNTSRRWPIIGVIAAIASLPVHLFIGDEASLLLAALALNMIGAIYIGFALADGRPAILRTEIFVGSLFGVLAFCAVMWSQWLVVVAFAAHGLWDFAHHRHVDTTIPRWYIPFCAVYDWVFAAGLTAIWIMKG
jgi:hypothetical protein